MTVPSELWLGGVGLGLGVGVGDSLAVVDGLGTASFTTEN